MLSYEQERNAILVRSNRIFPHFITDLTCNTGQMLLNLFFQTSPPTAIWEAKLGINIGH